MGGEGDRQTREMSVYTIPDNKSLPPGSHYHAIKLVQQKFHSTKRVYAFVFWKPDTQWEHQKRQQPVLWWCSLGRYINTYVLIYHTSRTRSVILTNVQDVRAMYVMYWSTFYVGIWKRRCTWRRSVDRRGFRTSKEENKKCRWHGGVATHRSSAGIMTLEIIKLNQSLAHPFIKIYISDQMRYVR